MCFLLFVFFFNDTATTEIYTLSLHDALPICSSNDPAILTETVPYEGSGYGRPPTTGAGCRFHTGERLERAQELHPRSEEHTSELQSRQYLVCRLLLEKKKKKSIQDQFCSKNK